MIMLKCLITVRFVPCLPCSVARLREFREQGSFRNKCFRNGSVLSQDIHLVPHQSNDYKTIRLLVVLSKCCSVDCSPNCEFEPILTEALLHESNS